MTGIIAALENADMDIPDEEASTSTEQGPSFDPDRWKLGVHR